MHANGRHLLHRLFVAATVLAVCGHSGWDIQAQGQAPSGAKTAAASAAATYRDGTITSDGRKIHYLDWGSPNKPAFIMVLALGRAAHGYDHIAPQLTDDYRVIAIDLRGH